LFTRGNFYVIILNRVWIKPMSIVKWLVVFSLSLAALGCSRPLETPVTVDETVASPTTAIPPATSTATPPVPGELTKEKEGCLAAQNDPKKIGLLNSCYNKGILSRPE
jgi:hypothetical protein